MKVPIKSDSLVQRRVPDGMGSASKLYEAPHLMSSISHPQTGLEKSLTLGYSRYITKNKVKHYYSRITL